MNEKKYWYLLTIKPAQDRVAEKNLINQGYEIYRPMVQLKKKLRGKMVEKVESLFPRYIFIQLDSVNDNWAPIRSTRGVASFVKFGIEPCKVPDALIQTLKSQEDHFASKTIELDKFKKGEVVIIETGAFQGLQAIYSHQDNDEMRSIILIEMMGSLVKMPIDATQISTV